MLGFKKKLLSCSLFTPEGQKSYDVLRIWIYMDNMDFPWCLIGFVVFNLCWVYLLIKKTSAFL